MGRAIQPLSFSKSSEKFRANNSTSRLQTVTALAVAVIYLCGCACAQLVNVDLARELCDPRFVQPYNDPLAGVDFLSEDEILVYTVCHSTGELAHSEHPRATDPNHLKAVILDIATATVKQRFDWPTRGRGSLLRVTHSGQLLLKLDNLLQTLRTDGTPIHMLTIPKVNPADLTFVALSPAVDAIAVTLSSEAAGNKTVNGVAVLDSRNLQPMAQWHEGGDWWNLAVSSGSVVRTLKNGSTVQVRALEDLNTDGAPWSPVWSGPVVSAPPLFVSDSSFVFSVLDSLVLFSSKGIRLGEGICGNPTDNSTLHFSAVHADRSAVSRDGKVAAMVCFQFLIRGFAGAYSRATNGWLHVTSVPLFRQLDSISLGDISTDGFDLALSPQGNEVAFIDRLRLRVFLVGASHSRRKKTVR